MIGPRKIDKPLVLYGYGKLGHLAEEIFKELKIPILKIIDKDSDYRFPEYGSLVGVCVANEPYAPIYKKLTNYHGWTDIVPVYDILEAYPEVGIHNGWFITPGEWNLQEMLKIDRALADKQSRMHYVAFAYWHRYRKDLMSFKLDAEDTTVPLPSTLVDIRQRQRVDYFADVPQESISVHNEGCELITLQENMYLFQKYRPKIAVAVYHSKDGLYKIEKFLMENLSNYTWTFRCHAYMGQAAYIYGVPAEKAV